MSAIEKIKRTTVPTTATKQTSSVRHVSTTLPPSTKAHTNQPAVEPPDVSEVKSEMEETNKYAPVTRTCKCVGLKCL